MLNPNKYLRTLYIDALSPLVGIPVWAKKVPKNINPIPGAYILIRSQSKTRTEITKNCWEWLCTVTIDIFVYNLTGYSNTITIDDIEEKVLTALQKGIQSEVFHIKNTDLEDSTDLDIETDTNSIERRVMVYTNWVAEKGGDL